MTNELPSVTSSSIIGGEDGTIDLESLSREISLDLAKEERYRAEDSMKKRAIYNSKFIFKLFKIKVEQMVSKNYLI